MNTTPKTLKSGRAPFTFAYRDDLRHVPEKAITLEKGLHGCFATDKRQGFGDLYYAMTGVGLLKVSADLTRQEIIELPSEFDEVNFHSTRFGVFDGAPRLILAANLHEQVLILGLDGGVEYRLSRPEFDAYADSETVYKPTDTALGAQNLFVADGYGSNYIMVAERNRPAWVHLFGGKTENPEIHGKFGTAHGMSIGPDRRHLTIADRLHARLEVYTLGGDYVETFSMPVGSKPCGIDYIEREGRWYAAVGSLDDPVPGRPAPIYILDGETHAVLSTIRPKEELGIERADHIHNVVWHEHNGRLFLVCQAWNPGFYFVLELM